MRALALAALLPALAAAQPADDCPFCVDWKWTPTDSAFTAATLGVIFLDWQGTRWALNRPNEFAEQNVLLGRRPSKTRLDLTVAGAAVGFVALSRALPWPYRRAFQIVVLNVEIGVVAGNAGWHGGLRFDFH